MHPSHQGINTGWYYCYYYSYCANYCFLLTT